LGKIASRWEESALSQPHLLFAFWLSFEGVLVISACWYVKSHIHAALQLLPNGWLWLEVLLKLQSAHDLLWTSLMARFLLAKWAGEPGSIKTISFMSV
jgi:hypothetical protein